MNNEETIIDTLNRLRETAHEYESIADVTMVERFNCIIEYKYRTADTKEDGSVIFKLAKFPTQFSMDAAKRIVEIVGSEAKIYSVREWYRMQAEEINRTISLLKAS